MAPAAKAKRKGGELVISGVETFNMLAVVTRKETTFTEFPGSTARSALHRWIRSDGARRLMLRPVRPRPDFQVTEVQERGGIFYVGASRAMEAHNKAEEP